MKKVRSLLKQWSMQFLVWRIDVKVKRLDGDDRILYLANALMDECERQGYSTTGTTDSLHTLSLWYYTSMNPKYNNFEVMSRHGSDDWRVQGNRTA